ncbi:MAG: hypothetical protein ACYTEP_12990, partial [Planctomycetota bacterium]
MRQHFTYLLRMILGGCIMVALGNLAADALDLRWKDIENYDHLGNVHWFDTESERADAVFCGTSATRHAIIGEFLANRASAAMGREVEVWNLCMPAATPEIATAFAEDLLDTDRPKILFLEATPFYWNAHRTDDGAEYYWRFFAGIDDILTGFTGDGRQHWVASIQGFIWGWESIWNIPSAYFRRDEIAERKTGLPFGGKYRLQDMGSPPPGGPVEEQDPARAIRRVRPLVHKDSWRSIIPHVAEICREKDIRLVMVNIPLYDGLRPEFVEGTYANHLSWMQDVCDEAGVEFLDLDA